MNRNLILAGLVGVVMMLGACHANGQCWGSPAYCGYPNAYTAESIPYFSLYPPVYYSYRVARTYGYSPFAYAPGVLTPGSESPHPIVQNIYPPAMGDTDSQQGPQPLKIDNPFVEQSGRQGVTSSRKPIGRRPQVVYPAAMASLK